MTFNPHDPEQVAQAEKRANAKAMQADNDLKFLLSSKQGRRFLWKQLEFCRVFSTSFTGNSQTFFNEGMRNVGLKLFNDILRAEPESFAVMQRESNEVISE